MNTVTAEEYTLCQMALFKVARGLDTYNPALVAEQFSQQGIWIWKGQELQGRDAILAALTTRDPQDITRHITSNLVCERSGPNTIEATCTALTYKNRSSSSGGPTMLALPVSILDYHDTFERDGDKWLISKRSSLRIFAT